MNFKRILIATTDESVASDLQRILDSLKVDAVFKTESGEAAVSKAETDGPDLAVIDIHLSDPQGCIDTAKRIYSNLNIPIVFVLDPSNVNDLFQTESTPPFGYVLKPVEEQYLKAGIEMAHHAFEENQLSLQTEDILQEDVQKYRNVIERAKDAIYVIQDGEYQLYNAAFYENLGYTEEELKMLSFDHFIHEDDRDQVVERYIRRISGEDIGDYNIFRVVTKNGDLRWVENRSVRIKWENRPATLNYTVDVTERQSSQEALKSSERQFRNVIQSSPLGLFLYQLEANGRLVFSGYNPAADRILGVECSQFMGKTIEEAFPPLAETEVPERYRQAAANGTSWHSEQIDYEYDQIQGAFEVQAFQTSPGNMAVYFFDITQRKQTEGALKSSERRFRQLAENIGEIFWIVSPDFKELFYVSPMFEEIWQIKEKDIYGNPFLWLERVVKSDRDKVYDALRKNKEAKYEKIELPEFTIRRPDGTERIILAKAFPIRDESGQIFRVAGVAEDITERKKTQELMIQTEKMMSVGGMAAGMAHEINNPLGSIIQSAQNIQRRFSPSLDKNSQVAKKLNVDLHAVQSYMEERNIDKFVNGIRAAGERAAKIIDDMLQFSRKSESDMAPTDLHQTIEAALTLANQDFDLTKKYDFKNIDIVKEYEPDLPLVPCTETQIEQVILNLLRNSAYSLYQKDLLEPAKIVLRTALEENYVRIEVEDNGAGIDETVKSRIFEPFFTTKAVDEGTGLGLSVSFMIITANHQGSMEAVSEPPLGATFIIRLPLHRNNSLE